jgi:hypothetical protein
VVKSRIRAAISSPAPVSHADDVSHAALRARLHASTKANDEIRRLCETYARDAASAEAKALGAAREIDDARRDAAEAAAVSAEAKRQVATLESRVARAEGGVADAAVKGRQSRVRGGRRAG